ncbi:protein of unknown function [Georgfuchsia toluolica]|uniref:Secretion system X translation initiation factor n=1 Tax=Georgfuchsia toluolica TaxID=424218 RepID=A0A916NH50_9PROT|nr:hypothetical protein [Georgfuchsia toluolica]CAG4882939.1 protein of unknown function [Georgfuchsia toluolica]
MKPLSKLPRRWWLALPTLLATVALSWLLNRPPPSVEAVHPQASSAMPSAAQTRTAAPRAPDGPSQGAAVIQEPVAPAEQVADVFAVRTWEPPPPPVDTTPQPPPPLPFKFLGRIAVPGKGIAFMLAQGERVLVVSVGDSIGSDYRVEKYEKGQLLFRYRPMNISQTLVVGDHS